MCHSSVSIGSFVCFRGFRLANEMISLVTELTELRQVDVCSCFVL